MNKFLKKLTGHIYDNRYTWGEFYWNFTSSDLPLSFKLTDRYSEVTDMLIICPLIFKAYIYLPTKICPIRTVGDMGDGRSYGFYVYPNIKKSEALVLQWGKHNKHIELPWTYNWYSTEILRRDSTTAYYEDRYDKHRHSLHNGELKDAIKTANSREYLYTYTKRNGEVQKRIATVFAERMTWYMRGCPWIKKSRTHIDVTFNEEIGEGTGTWKGGTIGCSYDILEGETSEAALYRMQKERKFEK